MARGTVPNGYALVPHGERGHEMSDRTAIGLLGYGTVGSAVDRMLRARTEEIARVAGGPVEVRRALVRDAARERPASAPDGLLTHDFADLRDDPEIRVVAEGGGGGGAAPRLPARAVRGRQVGRVREQAAARPPRRGAVRGR